MVRGVTADAAERDPRVVHGPNGMTVCLPCAVNEHESCQHGKDGIVCDGCAICLAVLRPGV